MFEVQLQGSLERIGIKEGYLHYTHIIRRRRADVLSLYLIVIVYTTTSTMTTIMSEAHRNLLNKQRVQILQHLNIDVVFLQVLLDDNTITTTMREDITAQRSAQSMASKLVDILVRRPDSAYNTFLKALVKTGQDQLASRIDPIRSEILITCRDNLKNDYNLCDHSVEWVKAMDIALLGGRNIILYGAPGMGKTAYVKEMITQDFVTLPGSTNMFEFRTVSNKTRFVVIDESSPGYVNKHRETLIHLCDKELCNINTCCGEIRLVKFRGQVIIIGSSSIISEIADDVAISRRFTVICADKKATTKNITSIDSKKRRVIPTLISLSSDEEN